MPAASEAQKLQAARRFAVDAARMLANTRCHTVAVLDVTGLSPVTDFMVLSTGTSPRQMKAAAQDVEEMAAGCNFRPLSAAGAEGGTWVVIDFVDVVVHVFSHDARLYYDLDNLWGDARKVEWQEPAQE